MLFINQSKQKINYPNIFYSKYSKLFELSYSFFSNNSNYPIIKAQDILDL